MSHPIAGLARATLGLRYFRFFILIFYLFLGFYTPITHALSLQEQIQEDSKPHPDPSWINFLKSLASDQTLHHQDYSVEFFKSLHRFWNHLDYASTQFWTSKSLFGCFQWIETEKADWNEGSPPAIPPVFQLVRVRITQTLVDSIGDYFNWLINWGPHTQQTDPIQPLIDPERHESFIQINAAPIGAGSFKSVYTAYATRTGAKVALIKPKSKDQKVTQAVLQEIQHFKQLPPQAHDHNIIRLLAWHEDPTSPWFAQELYPMDLFGRTEETTLQTHPLSQEEIYHILRTLSHSIAYLHNELDLAYLDLKLENILYRFPAQAFPSTLTLTDLADLVHPQSLLTYSPQRNYLGSFDYSSPELSRFNAYISEQLDLPSTTNPAIPFQWPGESSDEQRKVILKSDVFSQGVIASLIIEKIPTLTYEDLVDESNNPAQGWIYSHQPYSYTVRPGKRLPPRILHNRIGYLNRRIEREKFSSRLDINRHLLLRALHPDPLKRVNSTQWQEGIEKWIALSQLQTRPISSMPCSVLDRILQPPEVQDLVSGSDLKLSIRCTKNKDATAEVLTFWIQLHPSDGTSDQLPPKQIEIHSDFISEILAELRLNIEFLQALGTIHKLPPLSGASSRF